MTGHSTSGQEQTRADAVKVFTYVRDVLVQLSAQAIPNVDGYQSVLWLRRLTEGAGCRAWFDELGTGDADIWVSVDKQPEPRQPEVPEPIRSWIVPRTGGSDQDPPRLAERIPDPDRSGIAGEDGEIRWISIEDHPHIRRHFESFVHGPWKAWAALHRDWLTSYEAVYKPLFLINQELTRLGEELELIVGIGCVAWNTDGNSILRHLVTIQASLALDSATGRITIGPSQERNEFSLELDMLPSNARPDRTVNEHATQLLASAEGYLGESGPIHDAIRAVMHSIDGDYSHTSLESITPTSRPAASFAPAVILRKRSGAEGIKFFNRVIAQLADNCAIPTCISQLVTSDPYPSATSQPSVESMESRAPERTYFPLPANDDQMQIAHRISQRNGVLVQGPPGTGKSHTIANLLCHLLASGKRVLVTAQTPRALEVLRDKIKAVPGSGGMADLCVSMVGDDKIAQGELGRSVTNIIERKDGWDTRRAMATKKLEDSEASLNALEQRRDALRRQLQSIVEADARLHKVGEFSSEHTAQRIAELTHISSPIHGWLEDRPSLDASLAITAADLDALRNLALSVTTTVQEDCGKRVPDLGKELSAGEELIKLVRIVADGETRFQAGSYSRDSRRTTLTEHNATNTALTTLAARVARLGGDTAESWQQRALDDSLSGRTEKWRQLLESTNQAISVLNPESELLSSARISLPADKSADVIRADVHDLVRHFVEQGKSAGFWIFRAAVIRRAGYVMESCIIDGRRASTPDLLQRLSRALHAQSVLETCLKGWDGLLERSSSNAGESLALLRSASHSLGQILEIAPLADEARRHLAVSFPEGLTRVRQAAQLGQLASECRARLDRARFDEASRILDANAHKCEMLSSDPNAHPVCRATADALASRNAQALIEQLQLVHKLRESRRQLQERNASYSKIARQLPKLAAQVLATPEDSRWPTRFASLADAFKWAQLRCWLDSRTGDESRHKVAEEIRIVESRILELTGEIAAGRAWKSCFDAMSDQHRRSLVQWQQAIAKLGKGKGTHAHKWRKAAQQELAKCKDAIPAWIMPLYRVFETVPPSPGLFDVIIVDEASQCGIDGLGLLFLGKKVIVVGDNEQISPSYVGVNRDDVDLILKERLGHMESRQSFDLENSLFDHAARLFDARVTLREHFRCVPDIIRFSNGLSYDNKLVPLRQYPRNRLAPLVPKHVPHGTTSGSAGRKLNITEADALVEAVVACCKDVAYEGKSMGVISLLGEQQAAYIERQLLRILGPQEIIKRRLICGDAYSFQGDERHVIFMSLVAAPSVKGSSRFHALASRTDKQRFNVAASRAQDQCWLFHSIAPGDIGNSECMRKKLLTHFYDPARSIAESDGIDLPSLRRQASSADRPETPPKPFDSWFEVDVYLRIIDRGYMVRVQYPAGEYRIDLVIEGVTRLAVECDGDKWHGPERFDDDFRRQRQLERVGWQFWRIGGSEFYRSPAESLAALWARLAELGIQPVDSIAPAPPVGGHIAAYHVPMFIPEAVRDIGPEDVDDDDANSDGPAMEPSARPVPPVSEIPSS